MKKKPAVRHRLSTVQRIFFSYVFICLVPVVILAGVLAVSTFRAQQREDAARQAHTAELAARTLDAEFKRGCMTKSSAYARNWPSAETCAAIPRPAA